MKSLRHHIHEDQDFNLACLCMDTILFKSLCQKTCSISSFYFSLPWLVSRNFHSTLPHLWKKWMTVIRSILLAKKKRKEKKLWSVCSILLIKDDIHFLIHQINLPVLSTLMAILKVCDLSYQFLDCLFLESNIQNLLFLWVEIFLCRCTI